MIQGPRRASILLVIGELLRKAVGPIASWIKRPFRRLLDCFGMPGEVRLLAVGGLGYLHGT